MFPLSVGLGIFSYAVAYYGWLALRGYSAIVGFRTDASGGNAYGPATIKFTDVLLPSRLPVLQAALAAGNQTAAPSSAAASPGTSAPGSETITRGGKTYTITPPSQKPLLPLPGL